MRIVVVNPNTSAAMTRSIAATATAVAPAGTEIVAVNSPDGPASIEGFYDEAFAVPGLLREIARHEREDPANAYVIACFDDTGLDAARCVARAPVIGIGEAAFHLATLLAARFSVVTTLGRSVAALENNLSKYGLASRCARVRAAEVPVLSLEQPGSPAHAQIDAEVARALTEDRAEAIVLGCAGMTSLAASLSAAHGVPVIDGVAAAVKLAEGLAALGLRTSKICSYSPPLAKPYAGGFADDAPR
jgi:allantoin racemase